MSHINTNVSGRIKAPTRSFLFGLERGNPNAMLNQPYNIEDYKSPLEKTTHVQRLAENFLLHTVIHERYI